MVLVGAVFVNGPAALLAFKTNQLIQNTHVAQSILDCVTDSFLAQFCCNAQGQIDLVKIFVIFFSIIIFCYYFLATILPIDTIIAKIYPLFAILLIFMAVSLFIALLVNPNYHILPNVKLEDFFTNLHPNHLPLWPLIFVTIACGAISGFHATQSPMMARCMRSETQARSMFYGTMIAEGLIALIWVTVGLSFYNGDTQALLQAGKPPVVVSQASEGLLGGVLGGTLVFLGVVILPISTGDTAFRTGRLIMADILQLNQNKIANRILVALPVFALGIYFAVGDFSAIWMAFGWTNQTLACVTLWACSVFLKRRKRCFWIALIPACFMTSVCSTYFCYDKQFPLNLSLPLATIIGIAFTICILILFFLRASKMPNAEEARY